MQKVYFKEVAHRLWPKTKKELEKALVNAKKMIGQGEEYLKDVSEKGIENAKKLSLSLQKEKIFYALGKTISCLPKSQWGKNKKVASLIKEIKGIDKEIKKKPAAKKRRSRARKTR